ncbi:hypothetical protein GCM10009613_47510 [Pseudonocardia kongjuensis]|uniref:Uncharacterized protein n=1 Tax=Pseudonocardia kongjuensis TaxID=102227 RepID=A0ABN1Y2U9_9PSEU
MSAPHADDRSSVPPGTARNGHPTATVLDGPSVPQPRPPRATEPEPTVRAAQGPATAAPATAGPGTVELTGPVHDPGPRTPPMPWQAVPPPGPPPGRAPVPSVFPTPPPARPAWRRALGTIGALGTIDTGRIAAVAGSVRERVPHRVAAVAVVVALVLAVVGALTTGAGGPDETGTTRSAQVAAPAAVPADLVADSTPADPAGFGDPAAFSSPSGNIACSIGAGEARCDVTSRDWTAEGCTSDAGLVVGGAAGARTSCDPAPGATGDAVLDYGTHLTRGDLTCVSRRTGVECRDAGTGHGFTVARASYRLY